MTRLIEPELSIEFSPKRGWTADQMAAALEDNHKGRIISFERDPIYAALTKRTVKTARLAHRVEVVVGDVREEFPRVYGDPGTWRSAPEIGFRSEEHTSELQSQSNLVCRLLLDKRQPTDNSPIC